MNKILHQPAPYEKDHTDTHAHAHIHTLSNATHEGIEKQYTTQREIDRRRRDSNDGDDNSSTSVHISKFDE